MDTGWKPIRRRARRLYTVARAGLAGVKTGPGVIFMPGSVVSREHGGTIAVGPRSTIHRGAMLLSYGGFIRLGKGCTVNPYSVLYGHGGLVVGDDVRIAA